jgi:hypothetical protein
MIAFGFIAPVMVASFGVVVPWISPVGAVLMTLAPAFLVFYVVAPI